MACAQETVFLQEQTDRRFSVIKQIHSGYISVPFGRGSRGSCKAVMDDSHTTCENLQLTDKVGWGAYSSVHHSPFSHTLKDTPKINYKPQGES